MKTSTIEIGFNDVTLRDGEQAPGNTMSEAEKNAVAHQIARLGATGIEAGFPIASPGDFRSVRRIAEEVGRMPLGNDAERHPRISGLARLNRQDIAAALQAIEPAPTRGIHTFISTSQKQLVKFADAIRKRGGDPSSMKDFLERLVIPGIEEEFAYIRATDPDAIIQFSPEDWTRTDDAVSDDVVVAAAANGATIINLPDTVGTGIPRIVGQRVARVRDRLDRGGFGDVVISWHGHNDTGQSVACAMEALYGGARQFETTILGIGERTGNTSFEGVLASLDANRYAHEEIIGSRITDPLVRKQTMKTARLVADTIGIDIPREHPIVGKNAFAHESGIHADGIAKGRENGQNDVYEILQPPTYGAESTFIIGKHAGWANLRDCFSQMKLPFREADRAEFLRALKDATEERRKGLSDEEVLERVYYPTVETITGGGCITEIVETEPVNGCRAVTVRMRDGTEIRGTASKQTEGFIDAAVSAMRTLMPDVNVAGLDVKSRGEGSDAPARARMTLHNGSSVSRFAEDTDTSLAERKALVAAFNTLRAIERYQSIIEDRETSVS